EDGIRDATVTGVQTCALPTTRREARTPAPHNCANEPRPWRDAPTRRAPELRERTQARGISRTRAPQNCANEPNDRRFGQTMPARSEERRVERVGMCVVSLLSR